jgi:hypothetical protein
MRGPTLYPARVLLGKTQQEAAGNACMAVDLPISAGGVVFLIAFRRPSKPARFPRRVASALMRMLFFNAACSSQRRSKAAHLLAFRIESRRC